MSILSLRLAFCVTLSNFDLNVSGEAIVRVGNLGILPISRVQVYSQLNYSVGEDAEMHLLLPSLSYRMDRKKLTVHVHVQCMQNAPTSS